MLTPPNLGYCSMSLNTETWLRQAEGICATKPYAAAVIRAAVSREKSSVLTNSGHLMV